MAVIRGFEVLTQRCQVEVLTDSKYVTNGMGTWMKGWKARNWMTASKKPVQNKDLWLQLDKLVANHDVVFTWVAGGAHTNQQICHALAGDASSKQKATKEVKIL